MGRVLSRSIDSQADGAVHEVVAGPVGDELLAPVAPPRAGSGSTLAKSAASGVKWGLVSSFGQQFGRLGFMLVLARLLGPENFGIVALGSVYVGFVTFFQDQGFGAALIQKERIDDRDVGSVVWLNVVSSVVVVAFTLAVAPAVAGFFSTPELTDVLRALSLTVFLKALAVVPLSLLNRQLDFRSLAVVEIVSVLVGGTAGIVAALSGAGYWALVAQTLVADAVALVCLLASAGRPPLRGSVANLRAMLSFSSGVMASRIVQYASKNADNILVGRYLGAGPLAFYALSYRVLTLPILTIGRIMNQVAFPVFSRLQGQPERIRRWFMTATSAISITTYPALTLLILAAPDGVPFVFGERWSPAVTTMQVLTAVAYRSVVVMLVGPVFLATGQTRQYFWWAMVTTVMTVAGFAVGLRWGIVGVATCYAVVMYVLSPFNLAAAGRLMGLRAGEYTRGLVPATVGAVALACAWFAVQVALPDRVGVPATIASATAAGLVVYAAVIRLAFPAAWSSSRELGVIVLRRQPRGGATH